MLPTQQIATLGFALCFGMFAADLARAQDPVPPRITERVLSSAVLVRASTVGGNTQGAGCLVFGKGNEGLVATNAHIVQQGANPSQQVQCVFAAGTPSQMMVPAQVVAVDPQLDLALLRFMAQRMPSPVSIKSNDELTQGERVYFVAFDAESSDQGPVSNEPIQPPRNNRPGRRPNRASNGRERNPTNTDEAQAPSGFLPGAANAAAGQFAAAQPGFGGFAPQLAAGQVRVATVTEVQKDEFGNVLLARLDKGIDKSSTGSAVFNAKGSLVGVAMIKGDDRPFDLVSPTSNISDMLYGRVQKIVIQKGSDTKRKAEFLVDVELIDPLQLVKNMFALVGPQSDLPNGPPARDKQGLPLAASESMRGGKLSIANGHAVGKVFVDLKGDSIEPHVLQLRYARGDGSTRYSQVTALRESEVSGSESEGSDQTLSGKPREAGIPEFDVALMPSGLKRLDLGVDSVEIPLPGTVRKLCRGAGGRLLVLQMAEKGDLSVFDLSTGRFGKEIPAPANALIAANGDSLFVVSPADNSVQRWSFRRSRAEAQGTLPAGVSPLSAAAGFASLGDVLVLAHDNQQRSNVFLLLDGGSLEPRNIQYVWQLQGRRAVDGVIRPDRGLTLPAVSLLPDVQLRSSANGHVYGIWSPARKFGATVIVGSDSMLACLPDSPAGEVLPLADDSALCTANGLYGIDFLERMGKPARPAARLFPSTHPRYYVDYAPNSNEGKPPQVIDRATGNPVAELPAIRDIDSTSGFVNAAAGLAWDERIHYSPEGQLLLTIPSSNDKLVLQSVAFEPAPVDPRMLTDASGKRPSRETAGPVRSLSERTWQDSTGKFRITGTLAGIQGDKAVLATDTGTKEVPISRFSKLDQTYIEQARPLLRPDQVK